MPNYQYNQEKYSIKKVYYEGTDTLKGGYILCYNSDAVLDMGGETIADGKQCEGKFLRVEKPKTANAFHVAGIVPQSESGKVGPCWVTVIEPDGHFVPVKSDADVTAEDVLYIQNASYLAGASGVAAIGVAVETINRSETNGLVLLKCSLVTSEEVIDLASVDTRVTAAESVNTLQDDSIDSIEVINSANASIDVVQDASIDSLELVDSVNASTDVVQDASVDSLELIDSVNLSTEVVDVASIEVRVGAFESATSVASIDLIMSANLSTDVRQDASIDSLESEISTDVASIDLITSANASTDVVQDATASTNLSTEVVDVASLEVVDSANLSTEVVDVASLALVDSINASTDVVQDATASANLSTEVVDVASIDLINSSIDSVATTLTSLDTTNVDSLAAQLQTLVSVLSGIA